VSDNRSTDNWLIRGGLVFDGRGHPPERADVHLRDGRIVHIGPWQQEPVPAGARVLEADGLLVTPGLIDLHVHAYTGLLWSVSPHEAGLRSGVTTLLDTGSAGAMTWETFERCVLPHAEESAYALLNISL
jgi:dihydroorotase